MSGGNGKSKPSGNGRCLERGAGRDRRGVRRFRPTRTHAREAARVGEWVRTGAGFDEDPDEVTLFTALVTSAYRAGVYGDAPRQPATRRRMWYRRWCAIRERLVQRNLGLVYSILRRFYYHHNLEDDLLSDALFALVRAVDGFDPTLGFRFSTYASNAITRALIRVNQLAARYHRMFPVQHDVTFERPDETPEDQTDWYVERLQRVLRRNRGELTKLESKVLSQRFPLDDRPRRTLQQIGEVVGLSKEGVRRIQNRALNKLRDALDVEMSRR